MVNNFYLNPNWRWLTITCPFCNRTDQILQNSLAFAIFDKYPVNKGHLLIIPKRHFSNYFDATPEEVHSLWALVEEGKSYLDTNFQPDGYNIGINVGTAAGQTVMHLHIHLIPRYRGDIDNPTGGVRGVIPHKRVYTVEGGS
ncbi:HIT family protein [Thermincola potens]|uniref:Histidine triad (HIT) protein n=1 Tax=Thermincola potens (strain JR) TaxID=635013 RepID=D5XAZ9_THEPJ|nr:HIT family protein [Thermincola potens]ADG81319.1 histidine triad (HIT) protein [Thermincola potens JR]